MSGVTDTLGREVHAPGLAGLGPEAAQFRPHQLSAPEIAEAVARLTPAETRLAMASRVIPIAWSPGRTLYAASTAVADLPDMPIVAEAAPDLLLQELQRHNDRALKRRAVHGFDFRFPQFSARPHLFPDEVLMVIIVLIALMTLTYLWPVPVLIGASLTISVMFLGVIGVRVQALLPLPRDANSRAPSLSEEELPVYSVLVPLYRETSIVDQLVSALAAIDYPTERLDIKIILEANDVNRCRHVAGMALPAHFEVIIVPQCPPQTKPKALNYALAFARGDLVTIFDAEDVPDPQQLRLAAAAFAAAPADVVCLQARLGIYNADDNWLTRQFALEYTVHFGLLLPALASLGLPLPLGGTSNHFRTPMLRALGAWDPFNVTEDADLGIRLARLGYRSQVLDSTTREEACNALGNWMRQRSRWLKGWLQTWHVHMREPRRLWRELGPRGFITAQIIMTGILISALLHPPFSAFTVWCFATGVFFPESLDLALVILAGIHLAVFGAGYAAAMLCALVARRREGAPLSLITILTMPAYWLLMMPAAWLALWQFVFHPFVWNKTRHGVSQATPQGFRSLSAGRPAVPRRPPRPESSRGRDVSFAMTAGSRGRANDTANRSRR